jgi:hypothetical protein
MCPRHLVPPRVAEWRYGLLPVIECLVAAGVWPGVPGRYRRRERRLRHPDGGQRAGVGAHLDQVRRRRGDQQQRGQAVGELGGIGDRQAGAGRVRDHRAPVQAQAGTQPVDILGLAPPRPPVADTGGTRAADPARVRDDQLVMLAQPGEVPEVFRMPCRPAPQHDQRRRRTPAEHVVVQQRPVITLVARHPGHRSKDRRSLSQSPILDA